MWNRVQIPEVSKNAGKKQGFTLLEALIAMLIISLSVICFVPGFITSKVITLRSSHTEQATQAAEAEIEHWREAGYSNLPSIPAGSSSTTSKLALTNPMPNGTGSVRVSYLNSALKPSTSDSGRKEIDVTVGWLGGPNDTGTVTLSTLIVNGGL